MDINQQITYNLNNISKDLYCMSTKIQDTSSLIKNISELNTILNKNKDKDNIVSNNFNNSINNANNINFVIRENGISVPAGHTKPVNDNTHSHFKNILRGFYY
jgi:hypothetical protein